MVTIATHYDNYQPLFSMNLLNLFAVSRGKDDQN